MSNKCCQLKLLSNQKQTACKIIHSLMKQKKWKLFTVVVVLHVIGFTVTSILIANDSKIVEIADNKLYNLKHDALYRIVAFSLTIPVKFWFENG